MKIEIRKDVRDYILADVNKSLRRLGVSEKVAETEEVYVKYYDSLNYNFESAPIQQMPVMFDELVVSGHMLAKEPVEGEKYYAEGIVLIYVKLSYFYRHFDGGSNGCEIGHVVYGYYKDELPQSPKYFGTFISKIEGITI